MSQPQQTSPPFPLRPFLGPRYWLTWLGLGFLWLVCRLPFRLQLKLGSALGHLLRLLVRRRVHIVNTNLRLCFPQMPAAERQQLLVRHFQSLGMGLFETALSWWGTDQQLTALVDIDGIAHLQQALAKGKGVILITGHFTHMELMANTFLVRHPFAAMYRPMSNQLMDTVVRRVRERRSTNIFRRDNPRAMLRNLKHNQAVWFAPDQDYGPKQSVYVPFFASPAATITTTARFASISHAVVVPYYPRRLANGHYQIEILPALSDFPSGDAEADARRLNALLEKYILRAPEQYLWIHRRFKTHPQGKNTLYKEMAKRCAPNSS